MSAESYLKGIDVSHYQGAVNWEEVKGAGCAFAFAKATEGEGVVDPRFAANWSGMQGAGLVRGAYHFFRAEFDGAQQAELFLRTVNPTLGDLPPVVDVELNDGVTGATLISRLQAWLDTVEQQTGSKPIIYTLTSFWNTHFNDQFGQYPLWIAHYGPSPQPLPEGWGNWAFWQYSQSLPVAGVAGNADHDYYNGDASQLLALTLGPKGP